MNDMHVSKGPVASMPGSSHHLPEGTVCDMHEDRPAVLRIQGETDSFGCEYYCMCQACYDEHKAYKEKLGGADHSGNCSCGASEVPLFALRDWEEGSSGPLYYKCASCKRAWRERELQALREELARCTDDGDFGD